MKFAAAALALTLGIASPAAAEVVASSETGFVIRLTAEVAAPPADAWKVLIAPAGWWNPEHTWSGDSANLYIDSQATGCFCEKLPSKVEGQRAGSIEHMHIIYSDPGKVLRLSGGLGPLQSEAVNGTLTMTFKPIDGGTRILWEYVVGGYMRMESVKLAPLVDKVLAGQLERLGAKIGPLAVPVPAEPPAAETPVAPADAPPAEPASADPPPAK